MTGMFSTVGPVSPETLPPGEFGSCIDMMILDVGYEAEAHGIPDGSSQRMEPAG
jgi:hypothetical protein